MSVGSNVVFVMCFCHYPLCARLDWEELESKRLRRIVAGGPDLQRNLKYVEMVLPHDDYLPKINTEEDGIIMTDGHDSLRAVFEEEFMPKNPSRAVVRAVPATAVARKVASSGGGGAAALGGGSGTASVMPPAAASREPPAASAPPVAQTPSAEGAVAAPMDEVAAPARVAVILAAAQAEADAVLNSIMSSK